MHKNRKSIFGVGINDHQGFVSIGGKQIKEYQIWTDMLRRCYSKFELNRHPTYVGCETSESFKYFSNFFTWCNSQIGFGRDGWCLDKDILVKGNKLYSESTCVFVPSEINNIVLKGNAQRGDFPIGVKKEKTGYSSTCRINGNHFYLGRHDTINGAFQAYKTAKESYIKEVANKWKSEIDSRAYDSLMQYQVEITD